MRYRFALGLFTALCLGLFAAPALAVSCVGGGDVTALTGGCDLGPLHFNEFDVSVVGLQAGSVFIGTHDTGVVGREATLGFQVATVPGAVTHPADILLTYKASTLDGLPLIGGVNLGNGGLNVTIHERVCGSAFVMGACNNILADILAGPGEFKDVLFRPDQVAVWIAKDIMFSGEPGNPAFISSFDNSHQLGETPEPATLLLFGSSLTAMGVWVKRRGLRLQLAR